MNTEIRKFRVQICSSSEILVLSTTLNHVSKFGCWDSDCAGLDIAGFDVLGERWVLMDVVVDFGVVIILELFSDLHLL